MTAAPAAPPKGRQAPVAARPFIVGSRFSDDFSYDESKALTTATQRLRDYELDTDGYTSGLYLLVENVSANNATVTAAFKEDGPLNVFDTIQLSDTNNKTIFGPMGGHDAYECLKFGGYHEQDDAKSSPVWSVTTGTGATGGTFTFCLYLPIEIVHRTSLGAVQNKSASAVFRLSLTLAAVGTVFVAAPATSSTVRTRIQQVGWLDADATDIKGNAVSSYPPALNTMQFWDKQTFTFSSGALNQRLNPFSGGIRNLIWELRDSNLTRSGNEADFPNPFIFSTDKVQLNNRLRSVWRHMVGEDWDYTNGEEVIPVGVNTNDGGKRELGIYPLPFTKDFGLRPGAEQSFGYLWVSAATTLLQRGTVGSGSASHTFNIFVNTVQPANGDPKTLTGGR